MEGKKNKYITTFDSLPPTTLNFMYILRYIFDFTIVQPFIEYRYYNLWIMSYGYKRLRYTIFA